MKYREQLDKLIIERKGLIITKEVENAGIPRHYLTIFTRENKLDRVSQGVYLTPDALDDEMFRLQARSERAIFSHETALYVHGLTDRDPMEWSVTVPYGYNGSYLRAVGIKVYTVKYEQYQMGITWGETIYGRPIKVYDNERTICDIIRTRNNMDIAILNESIRRYLDRKDKNIPLLLRYGKELGVHNILRNYMEILL